MRILCLILASLALFACSEASDTRRIGQSGDVPTDTTAAIADSVLSAPIGYVNDRAPRTALVIGNGNYTSLGRLDNPANDAQLVSRTLQSLGFRIEGGGPLLNLSGTQMRAAIARYRQSLASRGGVGVVYFAGHAVQVNGRNWLAPSDVRPLKLADVSTQFIPAEALFGGSKGTRNAVNMVILDACRDNPFQSQSGARSSPIPELRGTSAGLSRVVAPPDTLVAFATAPGAVALDGKGDNSPYATALARALTQPGARVEDVFINTRNIVERSTNGFQTPWETSSLTKRVVLNGGRADSRVQTTRFDGRYVGALSCKLTTGDTEVPDFAQPGGRTINVDIRNGQGRYLKGPPEPLRQWNGDQYHEVLDFRLSEDGKVRVSGVYQFVDDRRYPNAKPGAPMVTDRGVFLRGTATADGLVVHGGRGPRQCTIEMTRL